MKILYVDLKYDYGIKARGPNQIGQIGFHDVFKKLNHEVVTFYYDDYLSDLSKLQTGLILKAENEKPDLIFFCLYANQIFKSTIEVLSKKYKTMNWFGDDQWRFDNFTVNYAPLFTYNITTDPFALPKYNKIGANVILSQWAALNLESLDRPIKNSYKYDVSFIGGFHGVRKWFISEFEKAGLAVATFGNGWPNGPTSLDEMVSTFESSKINLNLSNSINYDLRYLCHHWKNPIQAFRSDKNSSQVKARNFEIPFYGGFQLTEYLPTLENYFKIGEEVICYTNIDQAVQLAKFYLNNNELRESIKLKSIRRAREEHTYLHRFQDIFKQL